MATDLLKKLKETVKALGGTIEDDSAGRDTTLQVIAPTGHTWDGDIHSYVVVWRGSVSRPIWPEEKSEALDDVLDRLKDVEPEECELDCEWCYEGMEGHDESAK